MSMLRYFAVAAALAAASPAAAAVDFVPPSDTTGQVFSTNANDGYSSGRGVVFSPTSSFLLSSVGLYQDLTNVNLSFTLSLATASTGQVNGGTVLAGGNQTVTTSGLQFVDFSFAPILLNAGTFYFLDFSFTGSSNQNFFFNQSGAQPYSQAGFTGIDGTLGGNTGNFVLARIQLNPLEQTTPLPEPATWNMMMLGFGAAGISLRLRKRKQAVGPTRA